MSGRCGTEVSPEYRKYIEKMKRANSMRKNLKLELLFDLNVFNFVYRKVRNFPVKFSTFFIESP